MAGVTGSNPESYTYDPVGNRLTSQSVSNYAYNNSNQLTTAGSATYTYYDNGNTRTKTDGPGTTTYNWDFENRLTSVQLPNSSTVTFKYDPFGRRIQKSGTSTTNYVYDGTNAIEEVDGSQNLLAKYSQGAGIDEPLSELRSGAVSDYEQDGLGSITSLSSIGGALANTYVYDSFGNIASSTGTLTNPYQYTGRDYDSETNLRYYRSRYYDPTTGRFLSEDPLTFLGGVNFYSYVRNSPVELMDPLGLEQGDWEELRNDIASVGWANALRAYLFSREALAAAQEWAQQHNMVHGLHNGPPDAFRHCFWSCTMAKYLGVEVALAVAEEHELSGRRHGQPDNEEMMDTSNNLRGRWCAANKGKNCWDACTDLYDQGLLVGLGAQPFQH